MFLQLMQLNCFNFLIAGVIVCYKAIFHFCASYIVVDRRIFKKPPSHNNRTGKVFDDFYIQRSASLKLQKISVVWCLKKPLWIIYNMCSVSESTFDSKYVSIKFCWNLYLCERLIPAKCSHETEENYNLLIWKFKICVIKTWILQNQLRQHMSASFFSWF